MEFGSLSHKGQGERECLHVFNATKHAHVTESANLLLERIWSVEDQDLLMVFETQAYGGESNRRPPRLKRVMTTSRR